MIDSTGALELDGIPKRMLVIGGGIIGLEMATVYDALGTKVTVVEFMDQIIPGADADVVKPLHKRIEKRYEAIHLKSKVTGVKALDEGLEVAMEGPNGAFTDVFDKVLVAVGRRPNGKRDRRRQGRRHRRRARLHPGRQPAADQRRRTSSPSATSSASRCSPTRRCTRARSRPRWSPGTNRVFDARVIPSVAYTDPEVAWVGLTETEAKAKGVKIGKGVFPWAASRPLAEPRARRGAHQGAVRRGDDRVIGAGIVGPNAGDLIAEVALAIEMGADATDIGLTIHPHPTLSETINFAAEMFEGTITDLIPPKKKH